MLFGRMRKLSYSCPIKLQILKKKLISFSPFLRRKVPTLTPYIFLLYGTDLNEHELCEGKLKPL